MRDIILARQKREEGYEQAHDTFRAVLLAVDYSDSANVARQAGHVWFQELEPDDPTPGIAFNRKCPPLPGLKVTIKRWPKNPFDYEVIDWDAGQIKDLSSYNGNPLLPQHALDHEPGGYDPLNVYPEMIVPLRCDPGGLLTVRVAPYRYTIGGTSYVFGGHNSYDLTSNKPAAGLARYVLVYLNTSTNALATVNGDTTVDLDTVIPDKPNVPMGGIASAYVRLDGSQTSIARVDIVPAREWLRVIGGGDNVAPRPGKINIGNVEYDTIAAAIAAAGAGDMIWVGEGTYTCDNQTLPDGVHLKGMGKGITTLSGTATNDMLTVGNGCIVEDLTITHTYSKTTYDYALVIAASATAYARNVDVQTNNTGGITSYALFVSSGAVLHTFNLDASGGGTSTGNAVWVAGTVYLHHGKFDGVGFDVGGTGTVYCYRPVSVNNSVATSGSLYGEWLDGNGVTYYAGQTPGEGNFPAWSSANNRWELVGGVDRPLFSAYKSSASTNATGDGTAPTVVFDTEISDRNSNYNNSTGVFTAPVTGKYLFTINVMIYTISSSHTSGLIQLVTSNRTYAIGYINPYNAKHTNTDVYSFDVSVIADLDNGDTAYVAVQVLGGTKTVGVYGAGAPYTSLQGYLLL